jgi:hypothetical protein
VENARTHKNWRAAQVNFNVHARPKIMFVFVCDMTLHTGSLVVLVCPLKALVHEAKSYPDTEAVMLDQIEPAHFKDMHQV